MSDKKKDDLEIVRVLTEALEPFTQEERERIMRWSREKLGMSASQAPLEYITRQGQTPATTHQSVVQGALNDIKSFVQNKKPRSDVQFAAVVAYFYRFAVSEIEHKETISAKDLQDAGRQARGYGFKNALKTLNNAVGLGYFNRAGRGAFTLNAVGENLVAMVLPGGATENDSSRTRGVRKKAKKNKGSKK